MRNTRGGMGRLRRAVALAALAAVSVPVLHVDTPARAAGRGLRIVDVSVDGRGDVALNETLIVQFNRNVRASSVNRRSVQLRAVDASGAGLTRPIQGRLEVEGRLVRFRPMVPTHLLSESGDFFPEGTPEADLGLQLGLAPSTPHELRIGGRTGRRSVRGRGGQAMRRNRKVRFTTAVANTYSADSSLDPVPPRVRFSNPADRIAAASDQYAVHGGTPEVPRNAYATLFLRRVPLNLDNLRVPGAVSFDLLEEDGDPSLRRQIDGSTFVSQRLDDVQLQFLPAFELPARSVFVLRLGTEVTDLSGMFPIQGDHERQRLRDLYEFLDAARAENPLLEPELLPDPPLHLTFDWPASDSSRAVLKRNLLELGDLHPEELDPRVLMIFSTAD